MHDQGLKDPRRASGGFTRVPPAEFDQVDLEWLKAIPGVPKIDFKQMLANIDNEEWDVWKLPAPAQGLAVTYPEKGLLFIHYLHGEGLFGRLTVDDLLEASRAEGLDGIEAEVQSPGMKAILLRLGFTVTEVGPNLTRMELRNGR